MLTENDVIAAVCGELTRAGWETTSTAMTRQRGDDIVARKGNERLLVEAKRATSSKATTARFGSAFNRGQVGTHVALAVLRSLRVASEGSARAAVALPDNAHHNVTRSR